MVRHISLCLLLDAAGNMENTESWPKRTKVCEKRTGNIKGQRVLIQLARHWINYYAFKMNNLFTRGLGILT